MANADQPKGFRPYGKVKQVAIMESGSACYPGDFVRLAADGQVDPVAAGATILGLCLDYASGASEKVHVSIDPEQLYIAQASGSEIDAQTDIGNDADVLATAGSSTYKLSRMEVDSATLSTADGQLTIIGLVNAPSNAFGANAQVIVRINEHQAFGKDAFAGI